MREDYTHIAVVLDSSGSMQSILNDTIGGFNAFLQKQKEAPGFATLSLVEFPKYPNSLGGIPIWVWDATRIKEPQINVDMKADFLYIAEVQPLNNDNYRPSGGTPLLDTIAETIIRTGRALKALPETLRPAKVLFVIITDGEENSSRFYNYQKISEMIKHQSVVYKWEFIYLGANQDAIGEAGKMGIASTRAVGYGLASAHIGATYDTLSTKTASFRAAVASVASNALDFNDEERKVMGESK